jgi:hypothetical protein
LTDSDVEPIEEADLCDSYKAAAIASQSRNSTSSKANRIGNSGELGALAALLFVAVNIGRYINAHV